MSLTAGSITNAHLNGGITSDKIVSINSDQITGAISTT
jgi:hypothetical protein